MKKNKKIKKYPKSIQNHQCLGPCYEPNVEIIHPIFLNKIRKNEYPICPTDYYEVIDERTGKTHYAEYDNCENPTHNTDISTPETLTIFQSGFTKEIFLSYYYEINSFEEMIEWLATNKFAILETKERIVNASLNLYGDNLDFFDEIFIDFYCDYIKEKFLGAVYKEIQQYIGVENNEVFIIDESNNKLKNNEYYIERINYIAEKFFNNFETKKFLTKFLKSKNILFEDYDDILYIIYKEHVEYIKNSIFFILGKK
jgi:hypothetical protein